MCFMSPLSNVSCGVASSLTLLAPQPSKSSTARRAGEGNKHLAENSAVGLGIPDHETKPRRNDQVCL